MRPPSPRACASAAGRIGYLATIGFCFLALSPVGAGAVEVLRGRCHMDTCSWFSLEEKELVGTSSEGALFKVAFKGWQSHRPDGRYDRKAPRQGGTITVSYVFCSKTRPAVIVSTGSGRWQVDMLVLNTPYGSPGALESTTATYYAVCHAVAAEAPDSFVRFGRHFGYPAIEEAPEAPKLARPQDILRP